MASTDRELLRHFLAAIAYRAQKSLRGAPPEYSEFSAGGRTRTPVETLRHMTSVLGYARTFFIGGSYPRRPEPLPTFAGEIERFHAMVAEVGAFLAAETPLLGISAAISLNLGIFNLLPIPILDGGVIMLLLVESLIRRDISLAIKERIYQAAFVFLVLFAAMVIYNDLVKTLPGLAQRLP